MFLGFAIHNLLALYLEGVSISREVYLPVERLSGRRPVSYIIKQLIADSKTL